MEESKIIHIIPSFFDKNDFNLSIYHLAVTLAACDPQPS